MSLIQLSPSNGDSLLINSGLFSSGKIIRTRNELVFYTDSYGNSTGYRWLGELPHTISSTSPSLDGGISSTSWESYITSNLYDKLKNENITLTGTAHLPTTEVAYGLPRGSLKVWSAGAVSTSSTYWLYFDGTIWGGIGTLENIPASPFTQLHLQRDILTYNYIVKNNGEIKVSIPYEFSSINIFINGVLQFPNSYQLENNTILFSSELIENDKLQFFLNNVPISSIDYVLTSDLDAYIQKEQLKSNTGADMVGLSNYGTVQDAIDYITPEMFGAVGDGVTDDYDALQLTITFGASNKIPIRLSSKTYGISKTLILPSYTKIIGVEGLTKIVALNSIDDAIVKSANAPAGDYITTFNVSYMSQSIYIENLIIEGGWNGTAESTITQTECLRIYGSGTKIKSVRVGYCRGMGANLGGSGLTSIPYGAPSLYDDIRGDMIGKHGITIGGSSDNHSSRIVVRNAGLTEHNTYDGIRFGGGGGTRGDQFHVWQSGDSQLTPLYTNRVRYGLYLSSYDSLITNCHFEGCASAQIIFVGARNSVINTRCYSNWQEGSAVIMVADANMFDGFIGAPMNNTPATSVHGFQLGDSSNSVKNCRINAYIYGCKFINYINSTGRNNINVRGDLSNSSVSGLGTVVTGTIPDTDIVEINCPQYTGMRFATNVIISNDHSMSVRDINSTGNISTSGSVTLSGLSTTTPSISGQLYYDTNGNIKIKL